MTDTPMLEMKGITKRFPGVLANDNVDFDVYAGEVHTLLGENGAGKSTLMKVLYGLYEPDEGEILLNGEPLHITDPTTAIEHNIGMIHQHFMLVETLTVAENVALGLPSNRGVRTDLDSVSARIAELGSQYGLDIDPTAFVWQLAVGQKQRVEIIKALYREARLLILDEPTAVLTPQEVDQLFDTLRQLTADGRGLIFISHKLHEVLALSDRITVLRNGRVTGKTTPATATRHSLAEMMVGREVKLAPDKPESHTGTVRLAIDGLTVVGDRGTTMVDDLSLDVRGGEIVGIAGVSGNGQRELAEAIAGLREVAKGSIAIDGSDATNQRPAQVREHGLAYVPEGRMKDGSIGTFTVSENLLLIDHNSPDFRSQGLLDFPAIRIHCQALVDEFAVKTPTLETPVRSLSGGNIQKLILARELSGTPGVLVASQPTRGVDIGAAEYIHKRLVEQRTEQTAILVISEDLDEVFALSDRIAVMYEGKIMAILDPAEATREQIGLLMAGVRPEAV
ncbi:MAG TPA: ABC transporter ATP-binding protein [Acidimicrobiia bacterium]|nr:ABC transporter ATP-binding protein [Acidimicrobiia bacterium]